MIRFLAAWMLLQVQAPPQQVPNPAAAPPGQSAVPSQNREIPAQLGVSLTPDTVTVGQRFIAIVRVRVPAGATIEFPLKTDSATTASATGTQIIGKPVVQSVPDSNGISMTAAYRLVAWDTGPQRLGLTDIVVRLNGNTGYVSLADRSVFVRSVLPEDSAKRIPKPARPAIVLAPLNWLPWIILAAALAAAALLWRIWVWYRNRKNRPLDPFGVAEREFDRINAMLLIESGDGERHAAMMSDVMRDYLAARVPEIERSQTSSELLASAGDIHAAAGGMGELLWRTDLIKFAGMRVPADEAEKLGTTARGIVRSTEDFLVERERERAEDSSEEEEAA